MGVYSIGVVLAPALGPVLGGLLIDHLSWRYVFVAVPFAVLSIPLAMVFMPVREPDAAVLGLIGSGSYCLRLPCSRCWWPFRRAS